MSRNQVRRQVSCGQRRWSPALRASAPVTAKAVVELSGTDGAVTGPARADGDKPCPFCQNRRQRPAIGSPPCRSKLPSDKTADAAAARVPRDCTPLSGPVAAAPER